MTSASPLVQGPLSPGNVVSAALRLYRDRFKTYIGLSFKAYLWLFIPVYGWAKFGMTMGQMSRLAFQELIDQPETARESHRALSPKLWSFLLAGLLTGLVLFGANIAISMVSTMLGVALGSGLGLILSAFFGDTGIAIGSTLVALIQILVSLVAQLWIAARFYIPEVPLAMEPETDAAECVSRSWKLSKGSALRIQLVLLATYLVMLPFFAILFMLFFALVWTIVQTASTGADPLTTSVSLLILLLLGIMFLGGVLIMPFQQTVKGVLYYDLRSRREGLGLNLPHIPISDGPVQ